MKASWQSKITEGLISMKSIHYGIWRTGIGMLKKKYERYLAEQMLIMKGY